MCGGWMGWGGCSFYRPYPSKTIPLQGEISEHTLATLFLPSNPTFPSPSRFPIHSILPPWDHKTYHISLCLPYSNSLIPPAYVIITVLHAILYEAKAASCPLVFHYPTPLSSNRISNMSHQKLPPPHINVIHSASPPPSIYAQCPDAMIAC